eukprot:TRINITY_DN19031_c0_g1_i1.p1 TRINITY_DN19031_c0_g1~~TRINITY_DN19031_c0_g1_i1.p1  ORF type:complete len:682 (-),score=46.34 TRINITY_DN19031_c0_g1_i1:151-2196(-)
MASKPLLNDTSTVGDTAADDCRIPFSRLDCICDGRRGTEANTHRPYARCHVFLDRAIEIAAGDVTGLSDAYALLDVNGHRDRCQRSTTKSHTLSPVWRECFTFDVHHPRSVLCLILYDEDFGTELGGTDLLGMDDDILGFVDIRLDCLPVNEWVSAWFPLSHVDDHHDCIHGRLQKDRSSKYAGQVRLEIKLECVPQDEFFAWFLMPVHMGHDNPPLDLAELLADLWTLASTCKWWYRAACTVHYRCMTFPLLLVTVFLFIVYHVRAVLPVTVVSVPMLLLSVSLEATYKTSAHSLEETESNGASASVQDPKDPPASSRRRPSKRRNSESDSRQALPEAPADNASASALGTLKNMFQSGSTISQRNSSEKYKGEKLESAARGLQPLLSQQLQGHLRSVHAMVRTLIDQLDPLEQRLESPSTLLRQLLWCCLVAALLFVYVDVQILFVQLALVLGCFLHAWPYSFISRGARAVWYYYWRPKRIAPPALTDGQVVLSEDIVVRVEGTGKSSEGLLNMEAGAAGIFMSTDLTGHALVKFDGISTPCWVAKADIPNLTPLEQSPAMHGATSLSSDQVWYVMLHGEKEYDYAGSAESGYRPHHFKRVTLAEPTFCQSCGSFLWGVTKQGLRCSGCKIVVCSSCATRAVRDREACDDGDSNGTALRRRFTCLESPHLRIHRACTTTA